MFGITFLGFSTSILLLIGFLILVLLLFFTFCISSFKISKLTGFTTDAEWHSILFSLVGGLNKGFIDSITVLTKTLGASARCDLIVLADQASSTGSTLQITGTGKRRHHFTNMGLGGIEDFKIKLDFSNGNATNDCLIRKIIIKGHYSEA